VRIATWNLWGRYGPWEARTPVIQHTMRALDADIVALQEVWEDDTRNQAREFGYDHVVYSSNLERDGARSGNAIASRWPIARHSTRILPRTAGEARDEEGEERLVVYAEIDGPRGPIQVYCAHLSWRDDHSAIRQAQVAEICSFVRENRPRSFPAVLCGDLNADPHSEEVRMLTGHASVPVPGNPFIAPLLDRDRRIDFVLVGTPKLGGVGHVLDTHVAGNTPIDGVWPSDHFAVVTELRY
jgi:endonuclease/exonuclease/phosphatase family metal-dependent hydrolase